MNFCASDKLIKQIDVEIGQLIAHVDEFAPLIEKSENIEPTRTEVAALAYYLLSFYTGIENIFVRVHLEIYGKKLEGDSWHKQLLQLMHAPASGYESVISDKLFLELNEFRAFRHVCRQAYNFDLKWELMKAQVLKSHNVLTMLINELSSKFKITGLNKLRI